ncbi:hypothetical protein [Metamycoplasma equirhinis]|uniref:hypothetical protein n=1 Tax=Metamycoplasma equirhinis TaxID=92402 RepID=UPI00359CB831
MNNKKQPVKKDVKNDSTAELNMNNIFRDPIKYFYESITQQLPSKFKKIIDEKFFTEKEKKKLKTIEVNKDTINDLNFAIRERKKQDKISRKKAANGLIIFGCFFIVGLFLLGRYKKNRKIIKEFNSFHNHNKNLIAEKIRENNKILLSIYSKYSLSEIINFLLSDFELNSANNFDFNELSLFWNAENFACFNSINKYDIRNSYFYIVLYSTLTIKNIITYGSISIDHKVGDSYVTETITAEHSEPTPFIDEKNAMLILTNYLANFSFKEDGKTMSEKAYQKALKTGAIVLENPEFHKYYGISYTDKYKFFVYFQPLVQENYIKYAKYAQENKLQNNQLHKICHQMYSYWNLDYSDLIFSTIHNWLSSFIDFDKTNEINDINNAIFAQIKCAIEPTIFSITKAYLNKYIASEKYEEYGTGYISEYKDLKIVSKKYNNNILYWWNKVTANQYFSLITRIPDKPPVLTYDKEIKGQYINQINFTLSSYYGVNEVDEVFTQGHFVPVSYVRYYPFKEAKMTIYTTEIKLNSDKSEIYAHDYKNLCYSSEIIKDDALVKLMQENMISVNIYATENLNEAKKIILKIVKLYELLPILKTRASILVNNLGFSIHFNTPDSPELFDIFDKLNQALQTLI